MIVRTVGVLLTERADGEDGGDHRPADARGAQAPGKEDLRHQQVHGISNSSG